MKNPFEELSDLPSQRRHHRLRFFPWEDVTDKVPRVNSMRQSEGEQLTVESVQKPSQFNGVRQPTGRQLTSQLTQKPSQFNSVRQPEGGQLTSEPTRKPSQFNGIRRPGGGQVVAESIRRMPQVNGMGPPEGRQIAAEPTQRMSQVGEVKRPEGRQVTAEPTRRIPQLNGIGQPEMGRTLSAGPLKLPARGQPVIDRLEKKPERADLRTDDDPDFDKLATIPIMVLRSIAKQQGSPEPVMKSDISNAAGNAAFVSLGNIGGSVLKYGSNVVIQRGFGPAGFGLYSLSMSLMTLAAAIFHLGLDDAMVRYVSIYRARWQPSSLRGLTIFCSAVVGVSSIIGAFCVLFLAPWLAAIKHSPEIVPLLQVMSPMVPLTCMQTIWISGLQGFKEFKWRVLIQRVLMPAILIILLLVALFLFHDLQALVIATLVNAIISTILSLSFFFRKVVDVMESETAEYQLRDWFGFAAPNLLTSIIDTVLESVDTLLLAYFAVSNTALGQYSAAIKISGFILMPQASLSTMFAPTIAELHSKGERQKLEAMFKVVTKWAITFSMPIFGIGTLFSASLLSISGDKFVAAWPLAVAFCIGAMINVSTGSVGYMLLMTGHQRTSFLNSLTAVVVNVVVGFILTPRYGAMGVAIATGMAVSVVNLMRLLQVRILVKMQPYRWDVLKPVSAWLVSSIFTGILLYLFSLAHISMQIYAFHLPIELCLVPVFLAIYIWLLVLFKVGPEDQIVLDMLRRKFMRGKKNKKNKKKR